MIPKEHRTPRIDYLQLKLDRLMGDARALEDLTDDDHRLIGQYIQIFNFTELNVRRSIEIFAEAGLLDAAHTIDATAYLPVS